MFSRGMMSINEKMLNTADNTFSTTDHAKYFLYGETKRLIRLKNSFILSINSYGGKTSAKNANIGNFFSTTFPTNGK